MAGVASPAIPAIAIVHGPNLNLLGQREPDIYGTTTLADIDVALHSLAQELKASVSSFQSNHEGALIDHLQLLSGHAQGIVINAAALTHSSVGIRDALAALAVPFIEVHLSNVFAREAFRHESLIADTALGVICGFGQTSYELALRAMVHHLR